MVKTIIGGLDVGRYITQYTPSVRKVYGNNGFIGADGTEIKDVMGDRTTLKIRLERVPTEFSQRLAEICAGDEFEADYTTPLLMRNRFECIAYDAKCTNADPRNRIPSDTGNVLWAIDLTLESKLAAGGGRL